MCVGVPQVLLYRIMFTLRTSVLPPLSAVGAIVAILTDSNGASLTGGAVGGGQTPTYCTSTVCRDGQNILTYLLILTSLCVQASLCCFLSWCSALLRT